MRYNILFILCFIFFVSCTEKDKSIVYSKKFNNYSNKGFTLIYDDNLFKNKLINKKINDRSLIVFNKYLVYETPVKITNLLNGKNLVAKIGKKAEYPYFYNSVISKRIAKDLDINLEHPYIEIRTLNQKNSFVINKAKTFDEEKKVADKAPVKGIIIHDINEKINKKDKSISKSELNKNFSYIIKIADLYFEHSAIILKNRLQNEYNVSKIKIKKMSKNSFRIYKGPYKNLDSIKKDYNDIIKLYFDNIEIIKL